ncbi:MAG TPA: alpha/beta fold hydrolase [Thermoanaerobaculia bacterium]|nr:alpha/beta fold hydrolase [Thermoanaerobaculia bacterium]
MTVELNHSSWTFRDLGSGVPVVWIHGFPLSSRLFDPQLPIPGVRHVLPDLPGFGESADPSRAMTIDAYAEGVLDVMDRAGARTAVIAGLSMGGYIAFAVARRAMERLCGLMLLDTRETPDTPEGRQGRLDSIETVRREGTTPIIDAMLPKMLTEETLKGNPDLVERARRIMESSSPAGVIAALEAMAGRPDSSELLPAIEVPTLVVTGREDTITPPADAERMRSAIPGAELLILDEAAHLSSFERAGEFNRAATRFLGRVQPRR